MNINELEQELKTQYKYQSSFRAYALNLIEKYLRDHYAIEPYNSAVRIYNSSDTITDMINSLKKYDISE